MSDDKKENESLSRQVVPMRPMPRSFSLMPGSLGEAMELAKMIAESDMAPKDYKGKPANIIVAIQMGADVGLKPMQALQNIAVINGRPSIWGDAAIALCMEYLDDVPVETITGAGDAKVASCTVKRKGYPTPVTRTFSVDDAKKAGLWTKAGPWQTYPDRMLKMRARGFALRDACSDCLMGLVLAEEAQDYPAPGAVIDLGPVNTGTPALPPAVAAIERLSDDIRTALEKGFDTLNLSPANRLAKLNEYLGRALAATDPGAPTLEQEGVALVDWCRTEFASRQGRARAPKGEGNGKKVEPKAAEQGGAGAAGRENAPARPTVHQADNLVEPPKDELTADEVFRKEPSVPPAKQDNLGF